MLMLGIHIHCNIHSLTAHSLMAESGVCLMQMATRILFAVIINKRNDGSSWTRLLLLTWHVYDCGETASVPDARHGHTDDTSVWVYVNKSDKRTERQREGSEGAEETRFYYFAYELRGPIFLRDSQLFLYYEKNNNARAHILTIIRSYMRLGTVDAILLLLLLLLRTSIWQLFRSFIEIHTIYCYALTLH